MDLFCSWIVVYKLRRSTRWAEVSEMGSRGVQQVSCCISSFSQAMWINSPSKWRKAGKWLTHERKYELWFCEEAFHALLASWEGRGTRTIINILKEDKIGKLCKVRAFVGFARGELYWGMRYLQRRSSSWAFMLPQCGLDGCRDAGMDGVGTGCYPDS